ncbi:fructosamine-3-kinase isoform X1 [Sorex araneus]|uniref:fructosamine-3-kinase isoform X1 n=1 Tax=Sorex araneus TaxID=42254 RepID=UPI0024335BA5|nr:fructosamine-3-kinase isoform X1 [Sorex araneus]
MERLLRAELRTATLRPFGSPGAGCISEGRSYDTDTGPVFVKVNRRAQSCLSSGPYSDIGPADVRGGDGQPGGPSEHWSGASTSAHQDFRRAGRRRCLCDGASENAESEQAATLGAQMAELHLYNQKLGKNWKEKEHTVGHRADGDQPPYVTKFGFHTVTCCGFITQVNEWQDDWATFFTRHRLQAQLDLIEKDYADQELRELWARLQVKIPDLFSGLEIVPALLHGDLWSGNVAEDDAGPLIYDPASFYGHSEFELAIALMFGGFPRSFFTAYHQKIPKAPGFDQRLLLYQLFNYLNHWNHFGREYRSPSLTTMRRLLK